MVLIYPIHHVLIGTIPSHATTPQLQDTHAKSRYNHIATKTGWPLQPGQPICRGVDKAFHPSHCACEANHLAAIYLVLLPVETFIVQ